LGGFQQGRTITLRRGRSSQSRGALGIPLVGFYLQVLHHHFEGFFEELSSLNLQQQFGTIWRLGGRPTFLYFLDLERSARDLDLKLLPRDSLSPIYILGEFHIIWRYISSRTSCLGFLPFRRAQLPWRIKHLGRLALDVGLETLGGGSHYPDLSSDQVWAHLESSSSRAELLRASVFSWGVASSAEGFAFRYAWYWSSFFIQRLEASLY
jgi:hypothetical protein